MCGAIGRLTTGVAGLTMDCQEVQVGMETGEDAELFSFGR